MRENEKTAFTFLCAFKAGFCCEYTSFKICICSDDASVYASIVCVVLYMQAYMYVVHVYMSMKANIDTDRRHS